MNGVNDKNTSDSAGGDLAIDSAGRVLGLDFGTRRIGVAVSDPLNIIARPVGVVDNDHRCIERIRELVREFNAVVVVVGMPLTMRGHKGEKAKEVEEFVQLIEKEIPARIVTVDERLTSSAAHRTLRTMGTTRKQRRDKGRIDEMASALLLQAYLDRRK